jgi:chromate transporter
MKNLVEIFLTFAKMGCITFGGGYAMLPIIERELVQKKKWTNTEDVMQYFTIAQVTPGIIAVNVSTFVGYKRGGVLGGIMATLGFILPSVTMIVIVAFALKNFSSLPVVQHCFNGIRLSVGALILDAVFKIVKTLPKKKSGIIKNIITLLIFVLSFIISVVFNTNPIVIVLCAGLCGFVFLGDAAGGGAAGDSSGKEDLKK